MDRRRVLIKRVCEDGSASDLKERCPEREPPALLLNRRAGEQRIYQRAEFRKTT